MIARITIVIVAMLLCAVAARGESNAAPPAPSPSVPATQPQVQSAVPAITSPLPSAAAPAAQTAAPLAIEFDQVDRTIAGSATPPPLDSFASDEQLALTEQSSTGINPSRPGVGDMAVSMIPVVGTIFEMNQAKKQEAAAKLQQQIMMDRMMGNKTVLTRYAFYNGWTRVETANSIVITKPDQHLTIFIDPQAKTYRTYDTLGTGASAAPAVAATLAPSGTAQATSLYSNTTVDPRSMNGIDVSGFSAEVMLTLTGSTGACQDGTYRAKELLYYSAASEPPINEPPPMPLEDLAMPAGCSAAITQQSTGSDAPPGVMYVYRLFTVVRDPNAAANSSPGSLDPAEMMKQFGTGGPAGSQLPPNYMMLSERGNFRTLTAADASLFEIPQGFSEDR
jgi:hypothetical protein